jgi:hypothetical protein
VDNPPYNVGWHACSDVRHQDTAAGCCGICDHGMTLASVSVPVTGSAAAGPAGSGNGRVTRFVRAHCTSTGELSHRGMFLNRASVRRHIAGDSPLRNRAARRTWASGRSYWRPGPATSWPAGGRCGARTGRPKSASR